MRHFKTTAMVALPVCMMLSLSGCNTTNEGSSFQNARDSIHGYQKKADSRMLTMAEQAIADGNAEDALNFYEKLYLRQSDNAEVALNYAQILRKTGHPSRSLMVLSPFVNPDKNAKKKVKPSPAMLSEFASSNLELGHFARAVEYSNKILDMSKASPYHPQAYNLLGLAHDAQGAHKDAENSFRQALDIWPGSPVNVMNNLALSLAHQGMFDDALTTLRQARVMDPSKQIVARNIEVVTDLRNSVVKKAK